MAIQTGTDSDTGQPIVTFVLEDTDGTVVSVVGSFNGWTPGLHTLAPTADGTVTVSVLVLPGQDLHFRYLDSTGRWFDDADADAITEYGSVVSAARFPADAPQASPVQSEANDEIDHPDAAPTLSEPDAPSDADAVPPGPAKARRAPKQPV